MTATHVLRLGSRRASATVTEAPGVITVTLAFSGRFYERHHAALRAWLAPIVTPYDSDPRPLRLVDTAGGRSALVFDTPQGGAALIEP